MRLAVGLLVAVYTISFCPRLALAFSTEAMAMAVIVVVVVVVPQQ